MDNLRRRVDEIEALIAIFGDENIEVEDSDAYADAVRALDANEEACSTTTTTVFCIKCTVTDDDDDDDRRAKASAQCVISLKLPSGYPEDACLDVVSIMSDDLSRETVATLLADARSRTASTRGNECAFETLTDITEAFKSHMATARATVENQADEEVDEEFHAMIKIDHMNDSKAYLTTLKKWAAALGLGVRVFHKAQSTGVKRIEGVFVALWGSNESIKTFLTRLRTELVDVDARGAKCKERQSTLLCHRSSKTVKVGENAVEMFEGFVVEDPYPDEDALEAQLARLNLLHVGDGSQRFV
jgi:hypothetical protein